MITRAVTVGWDVDPLVSGWSARPALDADVTADACVVGLGGSGLAAIEELLARGLSVVGLDAGRVAAGAAGRNGGFLLGGGAPALPRAMADWGADVALALYRATLDELDHLIAVLGSDVIRRVGSVRLAGLPDAPVGGADAPADGAGAPVGGAGAPAGGAGAPADGAGAAADEAAQRDAELADCELELAALRDAGIAAQAYDGPLGRGVFLPSNAVMNPARRALGLAEQLGRRARLFEHSPVRSVANGRVTTAGGQVSAGLVVVAVDGRLEVLLPQLAPLVRTARLQMLSTTAGLPRRLPGAVYCRWGYDYAQQEADGRILVGGGRDRFEADEWTTATEPTAPVQTWIERVARRMAGQEVQVTHRWAASVGFTTDGKAVCTRVDDNVVACGGYSGTGNLVGPVAARAAVALGLDGTTPPAYFTS